MTHMYIYTTYTEKCIHTETRIREHSHKYAHTHIHISTHACTSDTHTNRHTQEYPCSLCNESTRTEPDSYFSPLPGLSAQGNFRNGFSKATHNLLEIEITFHALKGL